MKFGVLFFSSCSVFSDCYIKCLEVPNTINSISASQLIRVEIDKLIIKKRRSFLNFKGSLCTSVVIHSIFFEDPNDIFFFRFASEDAVFYNYKNKRNSIAFDEIKIYSTKYGKSHQITFFQVPTCITAISDFLFLGLSSVKLVRFHFRVNKIGKKAFEKSGIEVLVFKHNGYSPKIQVDYNAFMCFNLKRIYVSSLYIWLTKVLSQDFSFYYEQSDLKVKTLGTHPLYASPRAKLYIAGEPIGKAIMLPSNISTIPPLSLQGQGIEIIHIPTTIKKLVVSDYCLGLNPSVKPNLRCRSSKTDVIFYKDALSINLSEWYEESVDDDECFDEDEENQYEHYEEGYV